MNNLGSDSECAGQIFIISAHFLASFDLSIMFRESPANGSGLLGPQVQRLVLLIFIKGPQIGLLFLVHYNEYTCDSFPHDAAEIQT